MFSGVGRLGLRAVFGGPSFSVLSLFANGEQGVWYQNSDFSTLFQDAAGTTPVTALEQPVGLRLDKSKGLVLGSELVTNGDFATDTNWTKEGGWSITGGQAVFNGPTNRGLIQNIGLTANVVGNVTIVVASVTTGGLTIQFGYNTATATITAPGTYTYTLSAGAFPSIYIVSVGTSQFAISSVSVKLVAGNHAFQTTNSARPVLSARYNLLTQTEAFNTVAWTKGALTVSPNTTATTDPLGGNTADKLEETATTAEHYVLQGVTVAAAQHTFSVYLKAAERTWATIYFSTGSATPTWFNLAADGSGGVGTVASGFTAASSYVGNGWYRCSITGTSTAATWYTIVNPSLGNNVSINYAGTLGSGIYIWGADLRAASESPALPAYQRVGAATYGTSTVAGNPDYDAVGFPPYLIYDGGDWFQTSSINFSTGATNPPLGAELITNGDFSNGTTGWLATSATITNDANRLKISTSGGGGFAYQAFSTVIGRWYQVSFSVTNIDATGCYFFIGTAADTNAQNYDSGAVANGTYSALFLATATTTYAKPYVLGGGKNALYDNISVKEINQLYAPDKMSVFAGVRKLVDPGVNVFAIIAELSASTGANAGSFVLMNYNTGWLWRSRGSVDITGAITINPAAPSTDILTGLGDISNDIAILRDNALQVASDAGNQGTGNFGNYPLYFGARAGTSNFFQGRDYGFVIVGRAVTASELTNTEDYMDVQTFGKNMTLVYSDELTTALGELITAADGDQIYMQVSYV